MADCHIDNESDNRKQEFGELFDFIESEILCDYDETDTHGDGAEKHAKLDRFLSLSLSRAPKWQSIDSAPKDGTRVLVYVPSKVVPSKKGTTRRVSARFIAAIWVYEIIEKNGWLLSAFGHDLFEKHGGFWAGHKFFPKPIVGTPSHWMPLPTAPKASKP